MESISIDQLLTCHLTTARWRCRRRLMRLPKNAVFLELNARVNTRAQSILINSPILGLQENLVVIITKDQYAKLLGQMKLWSILDEDGR